LRRNGPVAPSLSMTPRRHKPSAFSDCGFESQRLGPPDGAKRLTERADCLAASNLSTEQTSLLLLKLFVRECTGLLQSKQAFERVRGCVASDGIRVGRKGLGGGRAELVGYRTGKRWRHLRDDIVPELAGGATNVDLNLAAAILQRRAVGVLEV